MVKVVGRVVHGFEVLDKADSLFVGPGDVPLDTIIVSACGPTNREGTHDSIGSNYAGQPTSGQLTAMALEDSNAARESVM